MKSHEKNWRDSRSRETNVGEIIAVTSIYIITYVYSLKPKLHVNIFFLKKSTFATFFVLFICYTMIFLIPFSQAHDLHLSVVF